MSRRPMCDAPPRPVSQSPLPQSTVALSKARLFVQQLLHHVQLGVGVDDKVLNEQAIDLRLLPRGLEPWW